MVQIEDETMRRPTAAPSLSLIGVALFMTGMFVWVLGHVVGNGAGVASWALYLAGGAMAVNGFVSMCRLWFGSWAWLFSVPLVAGLYVIGHDLTSDLSYALLVHMGLVVVAVVLTVSGQLRHRQIAG